MGEQRSEASRGDRLDRCLRNLLTRTTDIEAAAVVSFDGLPMASALPESMDEDRVAAMSAALLSLGERATMGLGRGELAQVFIEGENGTVFLVSCDGEAVLVAVAVKGAKAGLMLYEVKLVAAEVADALREEEEPASDPALEALAALPPVEPPSWSAQPAQPVPATNGAAAADGISYAPFGSESSGTSWS
jgi:uncharacterized protein